MRDHNVILHPRQIASIAFLWGEEKGGISITEKLNKVLVRFTPADGEAHPNAIVSALMFTDGTGIAVDASGQPFSIDWNHREDSFEITS